MKLTILVLFLAALCQAEESLSGEQKTKNVTTAKRALNERNAGVVKRAPVAVLPTSLPSVAPGIEYANSKDEQSEKSPIQEIYSTPLPKISDVLTGQGPPYQAAIASHLYSPVSIYQARISSPTTYEVSAPVPSHLAYSAKISYQQPAQYMPQFQLTEVQNPTQGTFRLLPQQQESNIIYQPQYSARVPQVFHPQIYHAQPTYPQNIEIQQPVTIAHQNFDQQPHNVPGVVYAQQNENQQPPTLREFKNSPPPQFVQKHVAAPPAPEQNQNIQYQGAVSYASFSQGAPVSANKPQQLAPVPPPIQQPQYQATQPQNQQRHIQYQTSQPQNQQQHVQYQTPQPQNQQQHIQYQTPQPQNQQQHIQYQIPQPQNQQQHFPVQKHLIYDFNQPRLDKYKTVYPAPPVIVVTQPVYQNQQPYQIPQYQTAPPQYQNHQPHYQVQPSLNQNGLNQPPPQPQVKYQATPSNNLVQTGNIERPIYFKPGTMAPYQTSTYPLIQYFGKYAENIFRNDRNH